MATCSALRASTNASPVPTLRRSVHVALPGRHPSKRYLLLQPCKAAEPSTQPGSLRRSPVLHQLAAAVEAQDQVRRYEEFAGRSAMIGFAVALLVELTTEQGVFFLSAEDVAVFAAGAGATLAAAAALAFVQNSGATATSFGQGLLESVYASLTAVRRSAAGLTQAQVDKAVDSIMDDLSIFDLIVDEDWGL